MPQCTLLWCVHLILPEQKIEHFAFDNASITYAKEAQTGVAASDDVMRAGKQIGTCDAETLKI